MLKHVPVFLILLSASFTAARADVFTIDPLQSSLTLSGNYLGNAFSAQLPDGLNTSYSGTIDATVAPSSIKFNSASAAANVSGTYQPAVGGAPGSAPGDYGGMFTYLGATVVFSFRDYVFSLTSPTLALTGGAFDASGLTFTVTSGNSDYNADALGSEGSSALTGQFATNGAGMGNFSTAGNVETLTIPIDITITYTTISPSDTTYRLVGNIVATAIPEPSTWALIACGAIVGFVVRGLKVKIRK